MIRYVINGELASISDTKVEITELPIRTWTQTYKEQVMEPFLNGSEKTPAMIQVCVKQSSYLNSILQKYLVYPITIGQEHNFA